MSEQPSLPQYAPTPRELDDVELLRFGVLAPLYGFEPAGGEVTLAAPVQMVEWAKEFGGLELVDPEGVPLAVVTIEDTYRIGALDRIKSVYEPALVGVVGRVDALPGTVSRAFGSLYVPPSATRLTLPPETVTVGINAPVTDLDLQLFASAIGDRPALFVVLNGADRPVGVTPHGLIKTTLAAADRFPGSRVVAVPAAKRSDPAADRVFRRSVVAAFAPGEELVWQVGDGELPDDIAAIVGADRPRGLDQGLVVFFTGFSGSGKSTVAQALRDRLQETGVRRVSLLDGDRVRRNLSRGLTFSREDREINIERIAWVAAEIARHGGAAVCSPIAPFDATRKLARALTEEAGGAFVLVHISTPIAECERRDRKGLYAKARRGEIEHFTGISSPYEVPRDADLRIDTTDLSVDDALDRVLDHLVQQDLLPDAVLSEPHQTN